jgi:predicted type IV restriction endonuclease
MAATIPAKVKERLSNGLKKFQSVAQNAKSKDINESDTVVIVTDMLYELFGFDKYSEITSEYSIKKTFCDLVIKIDGKIRFIIECKAAGLDLKADHIKQATDYGANEGVDWIILTNGHTWKIFKITFGKPISNELVYEFDILALNHKKDGDLEQLYYVCKESMSKSMLEEYHVQKQTLNRFFIGQVILTEAVLDSIKKTIKKITPDIKVNNDEIQSLIELEVLKREVLEGEKAEEAKKKINKSLKSIATKKEYKEKTEVIASAGTTGAESPVLN